MFFFNDREDWQQVGYCYEILPPPRDASHDNPPIVIGYPERQSSLGELIEFHRTNGSLAWFLSTFQRD